LTIPASYRILNRDQLAELGPTLNFPLIGKPFSKEVVAAFKLRYYKQLSDLERDYREDPDYVAKYLLQEYVKGEGVGIELLLRNGEPLVLFAHRRILEYPSSGGVSALAVAEPPDPNLVDISLGLLRRIQWEGIAMVEFRYDRASRKATLMEINGRYWGSLALSERAGVDFPYAAWAADHGVSAPVTPVAYKIGTRARWTSGILLRIHEVAVLRPKDGMPRRSAWREVCSSLAAFAPGVHDMLWSWRDPAPAVDEVARTLKQLVAGTAARLLRRVLPDAWRHDLRVWRSLEPGASRVYAERRFLPRSGAASWRLRHANSVLFVCHGNIIRSPIAEALLAKSSSLRVGSAGLHAVKGRPADPRALAAARELSVSLERHTAEPLTELLVKEFDLICVMDRPTEARIL
jgi:predicted protein tyrosine phosphatase